MKELDDYLKLLRPTEEDKAILIYGSKYHLWLFGDYIGMAMWVHDEEIGDSFQNQIMVNGMLLQFVYVADTYELVFDNRRPRPTN
jgi:hypothetical protein